MPRYIITGGLGTGKTSVVASLGPDVRTVSEPARDLIAEHRDATDGSPLDNRPELFVERLIARSIDRYRSVPESELTVFDRGLPDCVAYASAFRIDSSAALHAASVYRYETTVFVAMPWEEIYANDDMRTATFDQAVAFSAAIVDAYATLGYELTEVPLAPVDERVAFVRGHIGLGEFER